MEAHAKGSVFHTAAMIRAIRSTPGFEALALAVTDDDDKILALLSSFRIQVLRNSPPALTSRAVQFAEPLCKNTPQGTAALSELIAHHDKLMSPKSLMCEIRPISEPTIEKQPLLQHGYERQDYINYVVRLDQGKDTIWSGINKRLRQKLRSSWRKGVEVIDDTSPDGVQSLYKLLTESYARARVPLASIELFENTLKFLPPEQVRIRTAMYQGERVASVITLIHGDRSSPGTVARNALTRFLGSRALSGAISNGAAKTA